MVLSMAKSNDVLLVKIRDFVRGNWGFPFILVFIILLLLAAVSLTVGASIIGEYVAVFAYYALAIGVFLQLVCFLKARKKVDAEVR